MGYRGAPQSLLQNEGTAHRKLFLGISNVAQVNSGASFQNIACFGVLSFDLVEGQPLLGQFCLIDQQNWNAIAHGVDPSAAGALQGALISGQHQWFSAFGNRTGQDVQHLFQHHPLNCTRR